VSCIVDEVSDFYFSVGGLIPGVLLLLLDDGAAPPTGAGVLALIGLGVESKTLFDVLLVVLLVVLIAFSLPQPVQKTVAASKTRAPINLRMGLSPEFVG
jgi:hypothetical protein